MKTTTIFLLALLGLCHSALAFFGPYPDLKTVPLPYKTMEQNYKWCMAAQSPEQETLRYFSFWKSCAYLDKAEKKMDAQTLRYARLAAYKLVTLRYEHSKENDAFQFVEWLANTDPALQIKAEPGR